MSIPVPVFEVRDISKSFGAVRAPSNVTVTLIRGEFHSITGENGAGKSTLMNLICSRFAPPNARSLSTGHQYIFKARKMPSVTASPSLRRKSVWFPT